MKLTILAVGRLKPGPLADTYETFRARLPWPVDLREVEDKRGGSPGERKQREAAKLLASAPDGVPLVALDERGETPDTRAFAALLARLRERGHGAIAFAIGGADGLDRSVLDRADATIAFGRLTWPHLFARIMLMEQLYRAHSIEAGHPYHRD